MGGPDCNAAQFRPTADSASYVGLRRSLSGNCTADASSECCTNCEDYCRAFSRLIKLEQHQFKPRRSSFRQCRQSFIDLHCRASASPAVEPPYPEPAHPLFRIAAALLAIWQHTRDRLVNFIEWKGGQQDVTVQVRKACCCKPAAC